VLSPINFLITNGALILRF